VEKYMPLRMLNMIVEVTESALKPREAVKMKDVARQMGDIFRTEVLADIGNPRLKQACLAMITKLRLENSMLNKPKTGPATLVYSILNPGAETVPVGADKHLHLPERDGEDVMDELINNVEEVQELKKKKR